MRFISSALPLVSLFLLLLQACFMFVVAKNNNEDKKQQQQRLQVVYAGFGRTGTHSLGYALEQLGYNPIHGETICRETAFGGDTTPIADAIMDGDYDRMIAATEALGYNATLDIHGLYWKEIMQRRPKAKFIFMIRDSKRTWRNSMKELDWFFGPLYRYPLRMFKGVEKVHRFLVTMGAYLQNVPFEDCFAGTQAEIDARLGAAYDRFKADIPKVLKKHPRNTMLLNLKDGYPPLCEFLNVKAADCPEGPFPRLGTKWEFRWRGIKFRINEATLAAFPFLVLYGLYKLLLGLRKGSQRKTKTA